MGAYVTDGRTIPPVCTSNPRHIDALVLSEIRRLGPKTALDVGCGDGRFLRELGITDAVGVEMNEELAALAGADGTLIIVGNIEVEQTFEDVRARGPYEAVLLLDVIEHLLDPSTALAKLASILVPGGRVIVNVPNLLHYRERLKLLAGRFELSESGGLYDVTHLHFFSLRELERVVRQAGLKIERMIGGAPVRPGRRIASLPAPLPKVWAQWTSLSSWFAQIRPQLFARSFLLVLAPEEVP